MQCYVCGRDIGNSIGRCQDCSAQSQYAKEKRDAEFDSSYFGDSAEVGMPAGFWLRVLAYAVDTSILALLWVTLSWALLTPFLGKSVPALMDAISKQRSLDASMANQVALETAVTQGIVALGGFAAFMLLITWLYSAAFERSPWRATLGKRLLGLEVLREDGTRISVSQALLRPIARFVSSIPFCLGFVLIAIHERKKSLHDLLTGTRVVKTAACSWPRVGLALFVALSLSIANAAMSGTESQRSGKAQFSSSGSFPMQFKPNDSQK